MIAILALAAQIPLFGPPPAPPDPNAKTWIDVSTGTGPNRVYLDTASIRGDGGARTAKVVLTGPSTFLEGMVEVNCTTNQYRYAGAKSWAKDDPKNSRRICNRDFAGMRHHSKREVLGPERIWFEMRGPYDEHLFVNGSSIAGDGDSRTAEIILVTLKGLTPITMEFRCQGTFNGYRRGKVFVKSEEFAGAVCNNAFRSARALTKTEIETVIGPADLAPTWVYVPGPWFGVMLVNTASLRSSGTARAVTRMMLYPSGGRSSDTLQFDCAAKPAGPADQSRAELIKRVCQGSWPASPRYSAVALLAGDARQKVQIDGATDRAGTFTHRASGASFPIKVAGFTRHRIDWNDNHEDRVLVVYKTPTAKGDAFLSVSIGPLGAGQGAKPADS